MIEHIWTVLCSRAVVDKFSNNLSLENIIERIIINGEPSPDSILGIELMITSFWIRQEPDKPERGRARISFISPSGKNLSDFESELNLFDHPRFRSILRLRGLPVPEAGFYTFQVELSYGDSGEWQQIASAPVEIIFEQIDQDLRS